MERTVNKSKSFAAAHEWDIRQHIELTPQERQRIARELKRRLYGASAPDVRASHGKPQP